MSFITVDSLSSNLGLCHFGVRKKRLVFFWPIYDSLQLSFEACQVPRLSQKRLSSCFFSLKTLGWSCAFLPCSGMFGTDFHQLVQNLSSASQTCWCQYFLTASYFEPPVVWTHLLCAVLLSSQSQSRTLSLPESQFFRSETAYHQSKFPLWEF